MTEQHPITPPPELVQQWTSLSNEMEGNEVWMQMATCAARRPNPPSLKKQALKEMDKLDAMWDVTSIEDESLDIIRRALEQLDG